ncbi:D-hexose-6-phosphate mutarotase [Chromatiaceae bacterium AAb-1]|nr:D-hexose-6-phosphate mutarotase [Chromatiaceae bacterium AAb-1]
MATAQITPQTGFAHLTDLPCFRLQLGNATAVIAAYGAQVLSYCPHPQQDTLWLSPKATWHNNTAIRGGVPICWPWFGPVNPAFNPHHQALPNHGLVRNRIWQFHSQQISHNSLSLTLSITVNDLPHVSGDVQLLFTITLTTQQLQLQLHSEQPVLQQAALHSYFHTGNIHHTTVQQLPAVYQDKVKGITVQNAGADLTVSEEIDRIYPQPAAELAIRTPGHKLLLTQQGQDSAIVWNPWQDRSRQLADLADDAYLEFICVETARLSLQKPEPLNLSQTITATLVL